MVGFIQHSLLCVFIQGVLFSGSCSWHVRMPSSIKGLKGSCLVIPCTFDYDQYPPTNPNRVVWYQYASRGYPIVYDAQNQDSLIPKFMRKTRCVDLEYNKQCSVEISRVERSHHMERIYPWVDPENIGWSTHKFYEKTVTIEVEDGAKRPEIQIIGKLTAGQESEEFLEGVERKVTCSVSYSCSKHVPTVTWNYESMAASTTVSSQGAAQWRSVSTLTLKISAEDQGKPLTCYVQFTGAKKVESSIALNVKRAMFSRGWAFTTPGAIVGLAGSCVVIPCSFYYTSTKPSDLRVIWYLYDSSGHPPVFDQRESVVGKFRGRTSLVGDVNQSNRSLKIERLDMSHNQDRLYPWVDKNPITSYHTLNQNYYDKTVQLLVSDHAERPRVDITGTLKVGEKSSVSCKVSYACPSSPPTLTLSSSPGTDSTTRTAMADGKWETTVERT